MRRLGLGSLLIVLNAGLVLAAVVWVAAGAVRVLRELADRQAMARVDLAAQSAAAVIQRTGDELLAAARLAADHPDLRRIVAAGDQEAITAWLERFRRTSELTGCALFDGDRLVAAAGPPLPWAALRRAGTAGAGGRGDGGAAGRGGAGGLAMVSGAGEGADGLDGGGGLILGGAAPVAALPQATAVTALALDAAFAQRTGDQVGLAVAVLDRAEAERSSATAAAVRQRALALPVPLPQGAGGALESGGTAGAAGAAGDPGTPGNRRAAGSGASGIVAGSADGVGFESVGLQGAQGVRAAGTAGGGRQAVELAVPVAAARVDVAALYIADRPLLAPSGALAGVVESRLPTATVDGPLGSLTRQMLVLALGVAALATLASAAAGRWLGGPVRALTASAARLGRGDLTTPIGRAPGLELGALAATLEETRRQLLRLTAELRQRQAESEAVLTGIAEGVMSVDRDRRIRYLNPQAAVLLGLSAGNALGRFCGDVLNPRGAGGERPCADGCPIVHARFRGGARATENLQLAGGRQRSVVITSAGPVEGRQFLVLRDETDVELARRQRDAVLANISHEFKTPLAAQRASVELLRDKLQERGGGAAGTGTGAAAERYWSETQDLVLSLERGGLRLTQLIDNLLESVRIESGQDSVRRRPVALDQVIEDAAELTAPLFAQRGQRVQVELPFPLPAVLGDAPRLTQVFVNLLANAHKFAPAGSALRVGGLVTGEAVVLWVDDEGPGLPAAADSGRELFRRFVRSPEQMGEPEQSGMGLGLWIVQSIVERHGGTVEALRRNPGTRMQVTLPCPPAGAAAGENRA